MCSNQRSVLIACLLMLCEGGCKKQHYNYFELLGLAYEYD